ncbi:MAG TPA: TetR/AcrR family transcriptional regulator [Fimbriimonadaceae bacterium]|nr:TetR/AcrR family transcriptional regulator [Fimbriimonadaceae bacterium]
MNRPRQQRDPEATRRKILGAATRLFAKHGYSGTSIANVADAAGVQKGLVRYHFKSKDGLWQAACTEAASPLLSFAPQFLNGDKAFSLTELMEKRFRLMQQNPRLRKLILWTSLEQAPLPKPVAELIPRLVKRFITSTSADPHQAKRVIMLAVSAMDGWFLQRETLASLISGVDNITELDEAFLDYLLKLTRDEVTLLNETKS